MTSPSIVRPATPEDEAEIWRMFLDLHDENAAFEISEPKVRHYLHRFLRPHELSKSDVGTRGFIGVIGPHGALEGCIMLSIGTVWYSDCWLLEEHLSYVDPAHRKSGHAKELISYAKMCADKLGVKLLIGILSTIRTAAKVRLYERQLQPVGAFFIHPPPDNIVPLKSSHRRG